MPALFLFSSLIYTVRGSAHGAYYRRGYHHNVVKRATGITSPDEPTQTGTIATCNLWYDVVEGDSCVYTFFLSQEICLGKNFFDLYSIIGSSVEEAFGITSDQFLAWNPAVSSDCETGFWVSDSYCVGTGTAAVSSATTTTSSSASKTAVTTGPDKPTPTGQASNCNTWYDVVSGNTCEIS